MEDYIVNGVCLECGVRPKEPERHNRYHDDIYDILEGLREINRSLMNAIKSLNR